MPFHSPFRNTFAAGDLIYGLSPERPKLVMHLGSDIINAGGPATVDQYRKSSMQNLRKVDRKAWNSFLRDNEAHPKFGRYMQAIRAYNNDEELFAANAPAHVQNAAWRAKSKFGMDWTISRARGHIHFVLDGIDMGAVVTKTHRFADPTGMVLARDLPRGKADPQADKERTITHSELRWIYRNRMNLLVQQRVQFWLLNHPCVPPWENYTETTTLPSGKVMFWAGAWKIYRPTH